MAFLAVLMLLAQQDELQTHFDHALELTAQHQDAEAIAEFRKVLELKPGLYEADLNLGILLLRNAKPTEAIPVLKQAAEAKPQELRPNLFYAQSLLDSGDAAGAEKYFTAALQIDPKSDLPLTGLKQVAAAYEAAGDTEHALTMYRQFGDNARIKRVYLRRADDAAAAKQPAKALEHLNAALQLDPKDFDLRMDIGRLLRDQHNLLAAAQQFYAAAQLKPDSAPAWNELASALIIAEKYPEGLAALDRVRALGKEIPGNIYLRAITLDKLKQKPQAIAAYKAFLAADGSAHPDQEFLSRQRIRIIEAELKK